MEQWHSRPWGEWGRRVADCVINIDWSWTHQSGLEVAHNHLGVLWKLHVKTKGPTAEPWSGGSPWPKETVTQDALSSWPLPPQPAGAALDWFHDEPTIDSSMVAGFVVFLPATEWTWEMCPVRQINVSLRDQHEKTFMFTPTKDVHCTKVNPTFAF